MSTRDFARNYFKQSEWVCRGFSINSYEDFDLEAAGYSSRD